MKLVSWNVNGLRSVLTKGFFESIEEIGSEIVCIQETKAHPSQIDSDLKHLGYEFEYYNSAEKKGYSGTAVFSKIKPLNVFYDFESNEVLELNKEGRVITLEFENFFLVNVYTPNSKRGLERLAIREVWDREFLRYVKDLEKKKPVIFCGDLNVAHKEIDLKNPQTNKTTKSKPGNAGFTDEERRGFDNIVEEGFIDTFRYFYPEKEQYTWWSYMFNARAKNVGWRIDYFCVSRILKDRLVDSKIYDNIFGSDHCPICLEIDLE